MTFTDSQDPTSAAMPYPAHPTNPTPLSRNEIETLCLKAARGAGMAWGLAEEAGFAAGWLATQGVDGASALLSHLHAWQHNTLSIDSRHWHCTVSAPLCPISLGAALDDHAALDAGPWAARISLDTVAQPILLLPFLARAAQANAKPLALTWPGGTATVMANGGIDPAALTALLLLSATQVTLSPAAETAPCKIKAQAHLAIAPATLSGLNMLALRTTVPASDISRRGAGSTNSDND